MGMTIDEILAKEQEMSEIFQKIVDTQMVNEDLSLDEIYCGDTEVIEEELKRCQELADFHNQIVNIMRKYQKIEEIVNSKTTRLSYDLGFSQIKKVVEDGNSDMDHSNL